jgi:hypothetical protein
MPDPLWSDWLVGLNGVSALNSVSSVFAINAANELAGLVIWGAGTSAGQIVLEAADDTAGFTNGPEVLMTFDWAAAGKTERQRAQGPFPRLARWRISTGVVGGTVVSKHQGFVGP